MNYFSHYYFCNHSSNPYYIAGLIFPDLSRSFMPKAQKWNFETNSNDKQLFIEGWNEHIRADAVFHQWDFFVKTNKLITNDLRKSGLEFKKDFFIAHILFELCLDAELISLYPDALKLFYQKLSECNSLTINSLFERFEIKNPEMPFLAFSKFLKHQYLFSYIDNENIIFALNRINEHTGLDKFNSNQVLFLKNTCISLRQNINTKINTLQTLLKK